MRSVEKDKKCWNLPDQRTVLFRGLIPQRFPEVPVHGTGFWLVTRHPLLVSYPIKCDLCWNWQLQLVCGESRTWLKTLQCHPILFPTLFGRRTTVRIIFTNLHSQNFTTYFNRWNVVYQNMKEYSQKMQTIANFANQIFIEHHFGCISNN